MIRQGKEGKFRGGAENPIAPPSFRNAFMSPSPTGNSSPHLQQRTDRGESLQCAALSLSSVFLPRLNPAFILAHFAQAAPAAEMWPLAEPPPLTLVHIAGTPGRGSFG